MADKPRLLAKDKESGEQGCPSFWIQGSELVCLGPEADAVTLAGLASVLPGERAVRIPLDVARRALAAYDAGK